MTDKYEGKIFLDHIGVACNDLEVASNFWRILGLAQGDDDELVASQGVTTRFFSTSDEHEMGRPAKIELLEPTNDDTPIGKFLAKRGQGIQQICFRVENIVGLLAHLQNHGIGLINESPIQGAHGSLVAFVHPKSTGGVLVELCQL